MELFQTLPVVTFWTPNMETSRCNGAAILSRSWDISTSGLAAAIKNRLPVTLGSIRNRATEVLDPENGGLAFGTASLSGHKLRYKYFRFRLGLAAAILNCRLPVTSCSIPNSAVVVLDPENGGLVVETALLSCPEAEI